jgi:hypothetical protein
MAIGSYRGRGSRYLGVRHTLLPNLGYPASGLASPELTLLPHFARQLSVLHVAKVVPGSACCHQRRVWLRVSEGD